jgi:hypothetical protein
MARRALRVRAYIAAREARDRLFRALNACFDGFWLGLLSREHLHLLDETFYDTRRENVDGTLYTYFDEEYNSRGLSEWEDAVVRAYFQPDSRVVVTGAGAGREVLALLDRGFDAVGYEPNGEFVAAGADFLRRRGHGDRLRVSARDVFPPDAGRCDAVVVGWGSYMLIAGRSRRIEFLRQARSRLDEGDPILVSFFAIGRKPGYFVLTARIGNLIRRLRGAEPVESGDTFVPNYAHYFTRDEIIDELRDGGFELVLYEPRPYAHAVGRAS